MSATGQNLSATARGWVEFVCDQAKFDFDCDRSLEGGICLRPCKICPRPLAVGWNLSTTWLNFSATARGKVEFVCVREKFIRDRLREGRICLQPGKTCLQPLAEGRDLSATGKNLSATARGKVGFACDRAKFVCDRSREGMICLRPGKICLRPPAGGWDLPVTG